MGNNQAKSDLVLEKLVFDKLEFTRLGFRNKSDLELNMQVQLAENKEEDIYKVTLSVEGTKQEEYALRVQISGYFSVNGEGLEIKDTLLSQNAVAIIMPYVRSQISLLTAQPDTDCVVLPPFNITKMIEKV